MDPTQLVSAHVMFMNNYPEGVREEVADRLSIFIEALEHLKKCEDREAADLLKVLQDTIRPLNLKAETGKTLLGKIYLKLNTNPEVIDTINDDELTTWKKKVIICQKFSLLLRLLLW